MESLAPSLVLARKIQYSIECGQSVRSGLEQFLKEEKNIFSQKVLLWLNLLDRGLQTDQFIDELTSQSQKSLLKIIELGLFGESIYTQMIMLVQDIEERCEGEIELFLAQLPVKMMLPLLFFLFPAFLVLLLGPLLQSLVAGLS